MSVKRKVLFVTLILLSTLLAADGPETGLPTDVSAFVDQSVDFAIASFSAASGEYGTMIVEPFSTNGTRTSLGELLAVSIATRLANVDAPDITVFDAAFYDSEATPPVPIEFVLTGSVFAVEDAVIVVLQFLDAETREVLRGMESGFGMSPWVESLLAVSIGAVASFGDRLEPDSIDNPYVLSTGETVEDRDLSPEGDEDWYLYEVVGLDGQGLFTVGTTGDTDTYIEVYGPDTPDAFLAENDDAEDANARVTVLVEPGQVLWVRVSGYDPSVTGAYSLYSTLEPFEGDPLEPNDSMEDAVKIEVNGDPIATMLMPGSDEDWFYFDLTRPPGPETVVSIETTGALDTHLEFYNESGALLLENDDGGEGSNGRIDVFLEESGRYYVKVRHYDASDQGDYELSVRLIQASPDQWEPDNTKAEAGDIEVDGDRQIRNFTPADELDWVTFTVQTTRTVEIRTTGDIDTYITLYDRLGNVVAEDDDSGGNYNARIERVLQRGVYYIEVRQVEGDSVFGGEYGLSVQTY